jgi:hypothetical protein
MYYRKFPTGCKLFVRRFHVTHLLWDIRKLVFNFQPCYICAKKIICNKSVLISFFSLYSTYSMLNFSFWGQFVSWLQHRLQTLHCIVGIDHVDLKNYICAYNKLTYPKNVQLEFPPLNTVQ